MSHLIYHSSEMVCLAPDGTVPYNRTADFLYLKGITTYTLDRNNDDKLSIYIGEHIISEFKIHPLYPVNEHIHDYGDFFYIYIKFTMPLFYINTYIKILETKCLNKYGYKVELVYYQYICNPYNIRDLNFDKYKNNTFKVSNIYNGQPIYKEYKKYCTTNNILLIIPNKKSHNKGYIRNKKNQCVYVKMGLISNIQCFFSDTKYSVISENAHLLSDKYSKIFAYFKEKTNKDIANLLRNMYYQGIEFEYKITLLLDHLPDNEEVLFNIYKS